MICHVLSIGASNTRPSREPSTCARPTRCRTANSSRPCATPAAQSLACPRPVGCSRSVLSSCAPRPSYCSRAAAWCRARCSSPGSSLITPPGQRPPKPSRPKDRSEANASRWRPIFEDFLNHALLIEVPLECNGKSLCSLKIRIWDTLKWLRDHCRAGDSTMEPYARLKGRLRFTAADSALHLQVRQPQAFRAIPHLDPALQARLRYWL